MGGTGESNKGSFPSWSGEPSQACTGVGVNHNPRHIPSGDDIFRTFLSQKDLANVVVEEGWPLGATPPDVAGIPEPEPMDGISGSILGKALKAAKGAKI